MNYIFSNIIGVFVFDRHVNLIDKVIFKNLNDYENKENFINKLKHKHKNLVKPEDTEKIMEFFKDKKYFDEFYIRNIELTKKAVKESVTNDILIIQTVNNTEEINKTINILVTRLREWYSLYNPEFSEYIQNHEKFVNLIISKDKKILLKEINVKESMGSDLSMDNLEPVMVLAKQVKSLYELKEKQEKYLESVMKKTCPNLLTITGPSLGAKLIEQAGSLKRLTEIPASTIQLLGAEKALFRHMKNKKNLCPKYGLLHEHPFISEVEKKNQGKVARALADKISIAVKVDYFKGKFIGDKLKQDIEKRIKALK